MAQIPGTNVSAPIVPNDSSDVFASHEAKYGKGGLRTVATLAERDAITPERREAGMVVKVVEDGQTYVLNITAQDLTDNGNWLLDAPQGDPPVTDATLDGNTLVLYTSAGTIPVDLSKFDVVAKDVVSGSYSNFFLHLTTADNRVIDIELSDFYNDIFSDITTAFRVNRFELTSDDKLVYSNNDQGDHIVDLSQYKNVPVSIVQDLTSNSTTSVPSVKAVADKFATMPKLYTELGAKTDGALTQAAATQLAAYRGDFSTAVRKASTVNGTLVPTTSVKFLAGTIVTYKDTSNRGGGMTFYTCLGDFTTTYNTMQLPGVDTFNWGPYFGSFHAYSLSTTLAGSQTQTIKSGYLYYADGALYTAGDDLGSTITFRNVEDTTQLSKVAGLVYRGKFAKKAVDSTTGLPAYTYAIKSDIFYCSENGNLYEARSNVSFRYEPTPYNDLSTSTFGIDALVGANYVQLHTKWVSQDLLTSKLAGLSSGSSVTVEQNLSSNSTTSVPSVAAVKAAVTTKADLVSGVVPLNELPYKAGRNVLIANDGTITASGTTWFDPATITNISANATIAPGVLYSVGDGTAYLSIQLSIDTTGGAAGERQVYSLQYANYTTGPVSIDFQGGVTLNGKARLIMYPGDYLTFSRDAVTKKACTIMQAGSTYNLRATMLPSSNTKATVSGGTFTYGELQGTQPADSVPGQHFCTQQYRYLYTTGYNDVNGDVYVWVRMPKS
ncbi:hypothetical protein E4631_24000 [Hymenobacter sp. UV11]|uniref:hypothetical protein n=1 Tax=Hymenobacter sp. UV11 TaxID=1849735 RepID=UPI001061BD0C|nr:hypothetical protein [Hymenobacter sp. UV11]TDN38618.1 hypothetical protein A8B98_23005 [Hymenobacter sp. UV11]TFZ62994.1 hypothetical protein E4631_24000 [Hymenobacter sp. UV11]